MVYRFGSYSHTGLEEETQPGMHIEDSTEVGKGGAVRSLSIWLLSPSWWNASTCSRLPPWHACSLCMKTVQTWECKLLHSFCRVGGGAGWQR